MANKLELTWVGKEEPVNIEKRLLIEKTELSYSKGDGIKDNVLIHGDNLLALKALEKDYSGKVKCIYIDPPYNTGSAFEHYDDNLEHSTWLNLMKCRLEILKNLMSEDGSLWISIDDDEQAYLKVLCDEIFGRFNFVCNVIWEKKFSPQNDAKWLSDSHDYILVYAKNKEKWRPNLLPRTDEMNARYKNPDNDPRGVWTSSDFTAKTYSANTDYPINTPSGRIVNPPKSRSWISSKKEFERLVADKRIWFGEEGDNVPRIKKFLTEVKQGMTAMTIWKYTEVGHNQEAKKEVKAFNDNDVFTTPKPERLIERVLTLATNPGDLVLDSFLGSGTTAAVAHKMGRRWIGVEMGEHIFTHCKVRLDNVIDGKDAGGITKAVNWQGGGGYTFYELAPTLINKDEEGFEVINPKYDAELLSRAVALHEGYNYCPSSEHFWKQSKANENSYLFVSTNHITSNKVLIIKQQMKENEYLTIACTTYDSAAKNISSKITFKKLPQMLLQKCEYNHNDYSLNIVHPPIYEDEEE